jgi:hypothetical protein
MTFGFTGVATSVPGSLNPPFAGYPTPTALSGSFTFDEFTTDSKPLNLNRGLYNGTIQALTVNLGTYTWTMGNSGANFIEIRNSGNDRYTMQAPLINVPTVNEFSPLSFRIKLTDPNGGLVSDDLLHATPPSIGSLAMTDRVWRVVFEDSSGKARVQGYLTSLTAVPLPAAVILFGAGLVALIGLGAGTWRKRNNRLA